MHFTINHLCRKRVATVLFVTVLSIPLLTNTAFGQKIANRQTRTQEFDGILRSISSKENVTIIAEGSPLHRTLESTELVAKSIPESVLGTIKRQVAPFDYALTSNVGHRRVYVLSKTYGDVDDLPDVTLEECAAVMSDISRVTAKWNPRVPWPSAVRRPAGAKHPLVGTLMQKLSTEQLRAMERKQLHVRDLSPDLRDEVWRMALYFYVQGPLRRASKIEERLKILSTKGGRFKVQPAFDLPSVFGLELPATTPSGKPMFLPFSHPDQLHNAGSGISRTTVSSSASSDNRVGGTTIFDPTSPTSRDKRSVGGERTTSNQMTLGQLFIDRQKDLKQSSRVQIDSALADKQICIYNERTVPFSDVSYAVGTLFNLRESTDATGVRTLSRRHPRVPTLPEAIPQAVWSAFPDSLLRYVSEPQQIKQPKANLISNSVDLGKLQKMRTAAIKRLRTSIGDDVLKSKDVGLSLASLSGKDRNTLALIFMTDYLIEVMPIANTKHQPSYIKEFDTTVLEGGVKPDKKGQLKFSIMLEQPYGSVGGPVEAVGVGGVTYRGRATQ